jgi:hypothetical protein
MTLARFNFDSLPAEKPAAEKLNVVILYDRLADISKASATYLQLTRDLSDEYSPDFRLWRIDLTLESAFCFEAERDFAEADVIIVAVDGHQKCPPEFQRWRNGAGHEGGRGPHAVIALMDPVDEVQPEAETWGGLLHDAATQIHSEVFVCELADRK